MLIYVLRHGITQWNKLKKVQGVMDIPLAPEGIELAKRTGEVLKEIPSEKMLKMFTKACELAGLLVDEKM